MAQRAVAAKGILGDVEAAERPRVRAFADLARPTTVTEADAAIRMFDPAVQELAGVDAREARDMAPRELFRTDETHARRRLSPSGRWRPNGRSAAGADEIAESTEDQAGRIEAATSSVEDSASAAADLRDRASEVNDLPERNEAVAPDLRAAVDALTGDGAE